MISISMHACIDTLLGCKLLQMESSAMCMNGWMDVSEERKRERGKREVQLEAKRRLKKGVIFANPRPA